MCLDTRSMCPRQRQALSRRTVNGILPTALLLAPDSAKHLLGGHIRRPLLLLQNTTSPPVLTVARTLQLQGRLLFMTLLMPMIRRMKKYLCWPTNRSKAIMDNQSLPHDNVHRAVCHDCGCCTALSHPLQGPDPLPVLSRYLQSSWHSSTPYSQESQQRDWLEGPYTRLWQGLLAIKAFCPTRRNARRIRRLLWPALVVRALSPSRLP